MKVTICSFIASTLLLATPLSSSAQTSQPLTRAEVRQQLITLEESGYSPASATNNHYPADIQAAETNVPAHETNTSTPLGLTETIASKTNP